MTVDKQHRHLSKHYYVWLQMLFEFRDMAVLLISSSIWMLQLKSYNGNSSVRSNMDIREKAVKTEKVYIWVSTQSSWAVHRAQRGCLIQRK